jgi:ATP-dependent Clp protease ATP-binding subunit ClpB
MNLNKFTEKAQEAVVAALTLASEMQHAQVEPEHLLVTLVEQAGGVVPSVLRKLNVDPAEAAKGARDYLARQPKAHGGAEPHPSPRFRVVLEAAQADAKGMQDEFVSRPSTCCSACCPSPVSPCRSSSSKRARCRATACSRRWRRCAAASA